MHKFLTRRWYGIHVVLLFAAFFLTLLVLAFYSWQLAVIGFLVWIGLGIYTVYEEKAFLQELRTYQETLKYRIKKTGDEVIHEFPIGILLYNEQKQAEWCNAYFLKLVKRDSVIGLSIYDIIPALKKVDLNGEKQVIEFEDRTLEVIPKGEERLLYVADATEYHDLLVRYHKQQVVLGIIHMDNLDEVTQGMDEQQRALMLSQVTKALTDWAARYQIYLRRLDSDKFIAVMDRGTLEQLEANRFDILDTVRSLTPANKLPITLSIGIAAGVPTLVELGRMAQASLDIALGRGGDQAAVRVGSRLSFYGGKSNAVEKRTRVRARVISHALRDLIRDCDQVLIMGHVLPDMDAIGAAIGVLKAVMVNEKPGFIVLDQPNPSIERFMEAIRNHEYLHRYFIDPDAAVQMCTPRTLVVVVDTHRPSMVIEPKLLSLTRRIMVIDHHRRGEEFIEDPVLLYLEPYASSTCELVTELLEYQSERLTMDVLEATALLAGIVVDTRSFTYRTGARTFEAASFLRRHGADSAMVQRFRKEEMEHYVRRARLVANAEMYRENIAVAMGEEAEVYDQVLIAQTADTLLEIEGVQASFVIGYRPDRQVVISARSLGEINVQVIMEALGGGGHLTNAATQLKDITLAEAKEQLLAAIDQYFGEERDKR